MMHDVHRSGIDAFGAADDAECTSYHKVDRRYREIDYFLEDQLRYSQPLQEFRSIRDAILRSAEFDLSRRSFQYIQVSTPPDKL